METRNDDIVLHLPLAPSVNHYWRQIRTGRGKFISAEGRKFREQVVEEVRQSGCDLELKSELRIEVIVFPGDYRRRDLDNYLKALLDSLEYACVIIDDSQVKHLTIRRVTPVKGRASMVVKIRQLPPSSMR